MTPRQLRRLCSRRGQFTLGGLGCPGGTPCGCSGGTCAVTVCVATCAGNMAVEGATVTASQGGVVKATSSTSGAGCAVLFLPAAGDYELTVSGLSYVTYSRVRTLNCGDSITVLVATSAAISFHVNGCCGQSLPGATVTIGGVAYTTDASGNVACGLTDGGTWPYTVTADRFQDYSSNVTITNCPSTNVTVGMTATTGYACGVQGSPVPLPTTLSLTDSVYGGTALTYGGSSWVGTLSASYPGCGSGTCPPSGFTLKYTLGECVTGGTQLSVAYSACGVGECFSGTFESFAQPCPCDMSVTCAGQPNGAMIVSNGTNGPVSPTTNATNILTGSLVVDSADPFHATQAMTPNGSPSCGSGGITSIYPSGVTFTVTE